MKRWFPVLCLLSAVSAFAYAPERKPFLPFDAANRLTNTITPLNRQTAVAYDSRGLVSTVREPSGQTLTNFYDAKGRLTNSADTAGATLFRYDANNNVTNIIENGRTNTWTVDAYERASSYRDADGNLIQYRYDANGNLTNLIYPGNRTVTYAYDSLNRLTNVTDWANRKTAIEYDLASRVKKLTRPNGTTREINYDAAGQTTNIWERLTNGTPIALFKLNWNAAARVAWEFAAPLPHPYTPPPRTMTFDDDNRLLTFNGSNVVHDADGNLTSGPLTNNTLVSYTYDARNRLLAVGGLRYGYDPAGNRTAITNGANVTRFVVNPNAALSQVLMRVRSGVTNYFIYGLGLQYEITETATSTNTATYHCDYRGSAVALTDGSGNVTDRIEYSPYATTAFRSGTNDTPFLYNGLYGVPTDANGLLHMRARYYNPYLCRFLHADPSGFSGGLNFYAYADANPISMTNPFGLGAIGDIGGYSWVQQDAIQSAIAWGESVKRDIQFQPVLAGLANLVTFGLAGDASVAATGCDLYGNQVYSGRERAAAGVTLAASFFPVGRIESAATRIATSAAERIAATGGVEAASKAIPRQITVLGSRTDSLAAQGWPGHNVLDIPNWSAKQNIRWLDSTVRRGDEIYLATDPLKHQALLDSLPNRPFSAFLDLELPYLQSKGYIQQGLRMVPGP